MKEFIVGIAAIVFVATTATQSHAARDYTQKGPDVFTCKNGKQVTHRGACKKYRLQRLEWEKRGH